MTSHFRGTPITLTSYITKISTSGTAQVDTNVMRPIVIVSVNTVSSSRIASLGHSTRATGREGFAVHILIGAHCYVAKEKCQRDIVNRLPKEKKNKCESAEVGAKFNFRNKKFNSVRDVIDQKK